MDLNKWPNPKDKDGRISVMIEMRQRPGMSPAEASNMGERLGIDGYQPDHEFEPVPLDGTGGGFSGEGTVLLRGTVANENDLNKLRSHEDVADVWVDTPIEPFAKRASSKKTANKASYVDPDENLGAGTCPVGTCDCSPGTPKGTMADVAAYLKVNQIWARGYRGTGVVVGVLDSGITAVGRPVKAGETPRRIARVIDGWPSDWGTESGKWGNHGNMCATDVLGMAPEAQIYDLRIAGSGGSSGTISRAIQAFQWAINRHRTDGTPQVLTNSWGIFQEDWDRTYARNPNHPFTRKVVEAMDEGIIVLFAAGNCGSTCPDGRCDGDNGPGRSIWGANSHERVMTVGAVNRNEELAGYSSQGPGALSPDKPDFCSVTHFTGYNNSDSGTSAATPIAAGVVALLKQAQSGLTHDQAKDALIKTCKDLGPAGFDHHTGHGVIQPLNALNRISGPVITSVVDDRLRTQVRDDLLRKPLWDDIVKTTPRRDMIRTDPRRDPLGSDPRADIITNARADFGGTHPIGDVKSPRLDTLDERITRRPGGPRPGQPFVLTTPHRAPDWQQIDQVSNPDPYAQDSYYGDLDEQPYAEMDEDFGVTRANGSSDTVDQILARIDMLRDELTHLEQMLSDSRGPGG